VIDSINKFWARLAPSIRILNGSGSQLTQDLAISRSLKRIKRIDERTERMEEKLDEALIILKETKNLIIKKDTIYGEYIFEIKPPLLYQAVSPISMKYAFRVRTGSMSQEEINQKIEEMKSKIKKRGKMMIYNYLRKAEDVDRRFITKMKKLVRR
ncbi:MAG: hypothetical protein ACE5K0_12915, partial [Candidatus Methanofastidiosia archaeon]